MKRLRTHLTFANVASALALFIALGGTAWGVARNSVGTRQIRNHAIKRVDLHKNSVTFRKVANNAIGSKEVRANSLDAVDVDNSIQRSLTGGCPLGQAIASITPQGNPNCALIPQGVTLAGIQTQIDLLSSQLGGLAPQVAALCGSIRGQIDSNFDALDSGAAPVTGMLPLAGDVAGLLNAGLPDLPANLPTCP